MTPKEIAQNADLTRQEMSSAAFELGVQCYRIAIVLERTSQRFDPMGRDLRKSAEIFDRIKRLAESGRTLTPPQMDRLSVIFEVFSVELVAVAELAKEIPDSDTVTSSVMVETARNKIGRMNDLRREAQIVLDLRLN